MTVARKKPEKVWGFTVAAFFGMIAIFVVKYLVDFLLLPAVLPQFYSTSGAAFLLWLATSLIATIASMLCLLLFVFLYLASGQWNLSLGILVLLLTGEYLAYSFLSASSAFGVLSVLIIASPSVIMIPFLF